MLNDSVRVTAVPPPATQRRQSAGPEARVAEDKGRRPEEEDDDLLEDEEEDALFKARMTVANVALGYWKHALGVAVAVLVGTFAYGTWQNHVAGIQKDIHAQVAKVERKVSKIASADGATDPLGGFTDGAKEAIGAEAAAMEAIARGGVGAGAAYAWITAADLYDAVDRDEDAARCWAAGHAVGAPGALGWSAAAGHAAALAGSGDADAAVAVVKPYADAEGGGAVAEEAQLTIARILMDAGRSAEGIQALEQFLARFPESKMAVQVNADLESARSAG